MLSDSSVDGLVIPSHFIHNVQTVINLFNILMGVTAKNILFEVAVCMQHLIM